MIFNTAALLTLAATTAAGPLRQRQVESSVTAAISSILSEATSAIASATSAVESATTATSDTASSAASASASSAASVLSSSSAVASASATATGTSNVTNATLYGYSCPNGGLLTYAINRTTTPADIFTAYGLLFNWTTAIPPPAVIVNGTGGSDLGSNRTYSIAGVNVSEQLSNVTANTTTGYLSQLFITTAPIVIPTPNITIYNATESLTLYRNRTDNLTTLQYYVNFCASNQSAGQTLVQSLINQALSGFVTAAANATSANSTSSSTSAVASATSSAAVVESSASSAAASITSVVSSASSAAASAVESAVSSAEAAVSSATAVPSATPVSSATETTSSGNPLAGLISSILATTSATA